MFKEKTMQVLVKQIGNSIGFEIPSAWAEKHNIRHGSKIEIITEDDKLVILAERKSLSDMLSHITPDTIHREIPTSSPVGNEAW